VAWLLKRGDALLDGATPENRRSHIYVRVDATGIATTPPGASHRYKAMMPAHALRHMRRFDEFKDRPVSERLAEIKPFVMNLVFYRGRKAAVHDEARRTKINAARKARKAAGKPDKRYSLKERLVGAAI
jgi:hypothetical protein